MSRVDVGVNQLLASFKAHRESVKECKDPSADLLRFYAAECGMKGIWLRSQSKGQNTSAIGDEFGSNGHDLSNALKELRAPASACPSLISATFARARTDERIPVARLHEVWRYGAKLAKDDAVRARKAMEELINYVNERL